MKGMVGGEPRVVLDHVERIRDEDYQDLGFQGNGYRVEIAGAPNLRLDMEISSPRVTTTDPYHGIAIATAMSAVNAIPAVCAAPPGRASSR